MAKSRNTSAVPVSITKAWTSNPHDKNHYHCFEQDNSQYLYFEVDITDLSIDTIHFVLWNIHDPINPYVAELMDLFVQHEHIIITIPPDPLQPLQPLHLGPGPYCATLTASSPSASSDTSKSARKIVGNALYYYETWKGSRDCKYEK